MRKRERYREGHLVERITNNLSHHFEHLSFNNQLKNDFDDFMFKFLNPLFTYAETENFRIKVADIDLRSALYGKDSHLLKHLSNTFSMQGGNRSPYKDEHEVLILRLILRESNGGDFKKFIRTIRKYLTLLQQNLFEWNVVFYGHYRQHYVVS